MAENIENNPDSPLSFKGKIPPQFKQALKEVREEKQQVVHEQKMKDPFADLPQQKEGAACSMPPQAKPMPKPAPRLQEITPQQIRARAMGSNQLEELINNLKPNYAYDEIKLPSGGAFYSGSDGPRDGILHIRPMTGDEEQILATPRYIKRGIAINMIFQRCIRENYKPDEFLSVDRTFLLIWLRGISYGHEYEVEIKCPECDKKFSHRIRLDHLMVNYCPENFHPPLQDTLPKSQYKFTWRCLRGKDENLIQDYKDRRLKEYGDNVIDDSLMYRMSMMLEDIEGLTDKTELMVLLKKLPVQDIAYLRGLSMDPPFGVDTKCPITCPACYHDFDVELPLEAGFFFPRHHKRKEEINSNSGDT